MKIENSAVGFASQHTSSRQITAEESLRAWTGQQRPDFEGRANTAQNTNAGQPTSATLSDIGRQIAALTQAQATPRTAVESRATSKTEGAASQASNDPRLQLLIGLIEALTGRKVKVFNAGDMKLGEVAPPRLPTSQAAAPAGNRRQ